MVIETLPADIARVPTGMITLRDTPPMSALTTLGRAVANAAAPRN